MKTTDLKVYSRTELHPSQTKALRKEGKVPGALYYKGQATNIYVDAKEVRKVVYTADTYIVNLDFEGEKINAIVRDTQFHPVTDKLLHIDFLQVDDEREVELKLPVKTVGVAKGVAQGGKLFTKLRYLKVKGIPAELPDLIEVNVADLELGQSIKISDAEIEGVKVLTHPSTAVASVEIPRAMRSGTDLAEEGMEGAEEEGAMEEGAAEGEGEGEEDKE